MKPDYDAMSKAELRAYVLARRDDNEAFYKLIDRYKAESFDQVWHPCPQGPEDLAMMSGLIQEYIEKQAS